MIEKTRICFVCLGNIVRSPLAENLFRQLVERQGLENKYEVDSAGTSAWHVGEPPDPRMRKVSARHGLIYSGRGRQFEKRDFERFDLVVAMDSSNRSSLLRLAPDDAAREKIRLLRAYDPLGGADEAVPDPYYGGMDGFEMVYEIVERSCKGLLTSLEEGQG